MLCGDVLGFQRHVCVPQGRICEPWGGAGGPHGGSRLSFEVLVYPGEMLLSSMSRLLCPGQSLFVPRGACVPWGDVTILKGDAWVPQGHVWLLQGHPWMTQ